MKYLLDTNILLLILQRKSFKQYFYQTFVKKDSYLLISAVTIGEMYSLAHQRKWGTKKLIELDSLIQSLTILPIRSQDILQMYGKIDAYSQGKLANQALPQGMSARNMGKNDLWIAATAAVTDAKLLSTDKDFTHLSPSFLQLIWIDIQNYKDL